MVKVPKLNDEDIRTCLLQMNIEKDVIEDAVRLANGNFNIALNSVYSDEQTKYNFEKFVSLMRLCYGKKVRELIGFTDEISAIGREKQKMFLFYSMRMLRENFMMNIGEKEIGHMSGYESDFSVKFSAFINDRNIFQLYEEFNLSYNHISGNGYARIVILDLSLKIMRLLHL
jgi:DNA polymerase-3 subunit delta'